MCRYSVLCYCFVLVCLEACGVLLGMRRCCCCVAVAVVLLLLFCVVGCFVCFCVCHVFVCVAWGCFAVLCSCRLCVSETCHTCSKCCPTLAANDDSDASKVWIECGVRLS